jgi:hypothetical protein
MRTIGFPAICALSIVSWKPAHPAQDHRLLLTNLVRHPSPAMMIDLTGSAKPAFTNFVERAIADDHHPPSPRIRTVDALVAELEPPPAVAPRAARPTIGQGENLKR